MVEGWPHGLTRKHGAWSNHANQALARMFIQGRIKFYKAGYDYRLNQEYSLSRKEMRSAMKLSKTPLIQMTRFILRKGGDDGTDTQAIPMDDSLHIERRTDGEP